jgi:dynein heavy chain, axonemal
MRQWVLIDGPIDAHWVENMNTVLDENRKLCLLNGETILIKEKMNIIFEVDTLAKASPATVSRLGIICTSSSTVGGLKSLLSSFLV